MHFDFGPVERCCLAGVGIKIVQGRAPVFKAHALNFNGLPLIIGFRVKFQHRHTLGEGKGRVQCRAGKIANGKARCHACRHQCVFMQGFGPRYGGVAEIAVSPVTYIHGGTEIAEDHAVTFAFIAAKNRHQGMAADIRRNRQPGHIQKGRHQVRCLGQGLSSGAALAGEIGVIDH